MLGIAVAVVALGSVAKYLLPGRQLRDSGVPGRTIVAGGVLGIVGFFVVPVVGLFVGFVLGIYAAELVRLPRPRRGLAVHARGALRRGRLRASSSSSRRACSPRGCGSARWCSRRRLPAVTETIRVGVLGARGRMGSEVCRAVGGRRGPGAGGSELDEGDDLAGLVDAGAQVVVDFTHPGVVLDNIRYCVEHGIAAVVGTSGFDEARFGEVRGRLDETPGHVLVAPNFGVGAVLMMQFARAGGPVLRLRRGDRAAPRRQGRRPVGHGRAHRVAHRGGARRLRAPSRTPPRAS